MPTPSIGCVRFPAWATGGGGGKIGNAHLKGAFSEAACLLARESDQAKRFLARKEKKHGKPKALGILAARLGRRSRPRPFDCTTAR